MADYPTITYSNLSHKIASGVSGGVIQNVDEAIDVVFSRNVGTLSSYRVSFVAPYNQIVGNFSSNKELTKWEVWVTPAENLDYGPNIGNRATAMVGIAANTNTSFTIPITQDVFIGSLSNTYRICLMGQSSLDYSWDCTQLFMVIDTNTSFIDNYTEVDYIYQDQQAASGTANLAYIQSNLSFADIDAAEFDIAVAAPGGVQNNIVLCAYNTSFYIIVDKNTHRVNGFSNSTWSPDSLTTFSDELRHKVKVSGLSSTNTTKIRTAWDWTWWHETKWYGLKLYKNNVLVQDLVPCIRNSDGEPGMYDRVNNNFYTNAGAGTLKYGNIISLPSTYQQVEYIQNNGTQYLDLNFVPNDNAWWAYELKWMDTAASGSNYVMGSRSGSSTIYFGMAGAVATLTMYIANHNLSVSNYRLANRLYLNYASYHGVDEGVSKLTNFTDGDSYTGKQTSSLTGAVASVCLFALKSGNVHKGMRVYYLKVWHENQLYRDLVPCYRKSDNVIGMYDLIGKTFYTNAGSGNFTKGNNVNVNNYLKYTPVGSDGYEVHILT